jgi:hypothetical protein
MRTQYEIFRFKRNGTLYIVEWPNLLLVLVTILLLIVIVICVTSGSMGVQ